jgi:hypothetical protein
MYCTNCGLMGTGNFCAACGTRLLPVPGNEPPQVLPAAGWEHEVRYEVLLQFPEVRNRLAKCSNGSTKKMTGEEWLGLYDQAFKPLTGVSMKTVAMIVAPLYAKIGIKTGKTRLEVVNEPSGRMIVNALCALAEAGLPLSEVHQGESGVVIEAKLPSDLWAFEGQLLVTIERAGTATKIEAATNIPGQWFDWGKSTRCLEQLFGRLHARAA